MSYKKAVKILPLELIEIIQDYIDGDYIYIPRKADNKKAWGSNTTIKEEMNARNTCIYLDYVSGAQVKDLVEKYYLSAKSIQRIILKEKRSHV